MIGRLIFNAALFSVLLGGIGAFLLKSREELAAADVVVVVVLGSLWAGTLVAFVETRVYPIVDAGKRAGWAALCGSLAYLGLFSGVSFLAGFGPRPVFLLLGVALGAGSHGLRARLYGGPKSDQSSDDG